MWTLRGVCRYKRCTSQWINFIKMHTSGPSLLPNSSRLPDVPPYADQSLHNSVKPTENASFKPKKILVLTKMTRLEFERRTHATLNDEQLRNELARRGSDYDRLRERHDRHKAYLHVIRHELRNASIETRVVDRFEYDDASVSWADAIFSAGGDGTFLLAASRINTPNKPLIGINTDPQGSEGYLCLLKKLSQEHFGDALKRLLAGNFKWLYRQRIRIRLRGDAGRIEHIELHDQQLNIRSEDRWHEMLSERRPEETDGAIPLTSTVIESGDREIVLPELALNDVFMGESLSSRVSYYELQFNGNEPIKQKSSGITVCTGWSPITTFARKGPGTGSTSWFYNINKLTDQCVSDLLDVISEELTIDLPRNKPEVVSRICQAFNNRLIYAPDAQKMAYSVRDPVYNSTFRPFAPRGFATTLRVRSRCYDAHLVIDGGVAYKFNDGAEAILEVHPEDALKTVIFR